MKSIITKHYREQIKRLSANLLNWVRMNKRSTLPGFGSGAYACKPEIQRARLKIQAVVALYKAAIIDHETSKAAFKASMTA